MGLISTVSDIPVFQAEADLGVLQPEHGDLAVTVTPSELWIYIDALGWMIVNRPDKDGTLTLRVERLERLLADVGDLLADD